MTLSRYLGREVLLHSLGVLAVVVGIYLVRRLDALLGQAAEGAMPLGVALQLLGLRTLATLPSLCPVVLYVGVLLALGRLSRDRELIGLASCGLGPGAIARPILALALIVAAGIGWLALEVRPWAAARVRLVESRARGSVHLASLSPGRFYVVGSEPERVLFAERRLPGDTPGLAGVFLYELRDRERSVFAATRVYEERDEVRGDRILDLADGRRYDVGPEEGDLDVTSFAEYAIRTPLDDEAAIAAQKTRSTAELVGSLVPADRAELQWRLGLPVAAVLLALVATSVGRASPRSGKYGRLLVAVAIYFAYWQALGAVKGLVAVGQVPARPGLWLVHGGFLGLGLALAAAFRERPR